MKLKNQLKGDIKISQNELGNFCQNFGHIKLFALSTEVSKKENQKKEHKPEESHHCKRRFKRSNHRAGKNRFKSDNAVKN